MLSSYTVAVTLDDAQPAAPRTEGGSPLLSRVAGALLCFLVGAIYGAVGTVVHQNVFRIGELSIPIALILALVGVLALMIGFRLLFTDRLAVFWAALGMVVVIGLFSLASAGGSVLIPQGVLGFVWTYGAVGLATVVVAWPRLPQRVAAQPGGDAATVQADERHRPEA